MKVKDLMTTNITCIREDTSISQIALQMKKDDIGCIPVCDDMDNLKGIVTDRDIVLRAVAKNHYDDNEARDTERLTSKDIMTIDPVTVPPEMSIHDAALLFSAHRIRRLPVVESCKIVGMLSLGDLASKPVYIDEAGDALSAISITDGMQG